MDDEKPETSSQAIAAGDAAHASESSRGKGGPQEQPVFINKISGESQQPLIRNRQANDPESEKQENGRIPVMSNPERDRFHKRFKIPHGFKGTRDNRCKKLLCVRKDGRYSFAKYPEVCTADDIERLYDPKRSIDLYNDVVKID